MNMFKKTILFLVGFAVMAFAGDYTVKVSKHYMANPPANTEISGTYDLPADTIAFTIEYQKDGGAWTAIDTSAINKLNKTFSWSVPQLSTDGTYIYLFRLMVNSVARDSDLLKIVIDKTKPKVASVAYQPGYLSNAQSPVIIKLEFDEPVSPDGGKIVLENASGTDSLQITDFQQKPDSLTVLSASIAASDFSTPANWTGTTSLTISQFKDTLDNVMDVDASQTALVVDLAAPQITSFASQPDTMNSKTDKVTFTIQFDQALDPSIAGGIKLINKISGAQLNFNPQFKDQNKTVDCILTTVPADSFEGKNSFLVKGLADVHKNKISERLYESSLIIDTKAPATPTITSGNNNQITSKSSITIAGKKEKKATVFVNGAKVHGNISGTSWSYEASIPLDSFYVFTFTQVDSVGNPSDPSKAVKFSVLADHSAPQLKYIPPRLVRTWKDSTADSLCYRLDLYFDEQVVYQGQGVHLSVGESEQINLQYNFNSQGVLQYAYLDKAGDVETISTWVEEHRSVTVSMDEGAFTDLAGNPSAAIANKEAVIQNENYIAEFTAQNKYLQSGDTLLADISFKPNRPSGNFLFQLSLQTAEGKTIFTTSNLVDLTNGPVNIAFDKSKVTKKDNLNLLWSYDLGDLEAGKYIATVSAQDPVFEALTVPVTMEFYVLSEAPQIVSIKPAGTPEGHYISKQPDFVVEFSSQNPEVRIQSAKLEFQKATDYQHISATVISVNMTETDNPFIWEYNCEENGLKLADGSQQITLTVENQAGMSTKQTYVYNVTGETVKGIKDFFNYPNPFNALSAERTIITSLYSGTSPLELYIFDISGRLVHYDKLKEGAPGFGSLRKEFQWDGTGLTGKIVANGVYFARLKAGSAKSDILKIVVNNH